MGWMMYLIGGIIGAIIGVIGITLFLLSQKELKYLIKQLEEINSKETNQRVQVSSGNRMYQLLAVKINENITQKKKMQQEHIRMERELKETISNLSHDLRTPLTSIIGYLQLLEQEGLDLDKRKQYLNIVKGRAENLKGLVENFYELSQLNSSEYPLEYQEIHIDRMVCELSASFYQDFVDRKLELKIDIEEGLPSIYADERAVTRILLNLIQNALRYAKKHIEVQLIQKDEMIQLMILNEAGALVKEDVPYLFERFFMANRVRNGEGTGVGLAVVKKLVMMMDGKAKAELIDDRIAISISFKKNV